MNTIPLRQFNKMNQMSKSLALMAGLLLLPLAAQATTIAAFTSSSQTITINGTSDVTPAGQYFVGTGGFNHDTLAISNGGSLAMTGSGSPNGYLTMGVNSGNSDNAITIDGANSQLNIANGALQVGILGARNSVTVSSGGALNGGTWGTALGGSGGGSNSVTITGVGSTWTTAGIGINAGGTNTISILAGGTAAATSLSIGISSNSNTVTVSGSGSSLSMSGEILVSVGANSNNVLEVGAGGTVNVNDTANTGKGIVINSTGTGNKMQIDGGTLNVVSAGTSTPAIDVKSGALVLNSGTVTTERLLANTGTTSVVTFNGGILNTQGTTISNGAVFTVGNGTTAATLKFEGGSHSFANNITMANNSTLTGTGTISSGTLIVSSGATLSPGNSPGTLNTAAETWNGGGNYVWEINNATGAQGTNWDFINGSGALDLSALSSSSKFNINLIGLTALNVSGAVPNWNNAIDQTWKIATFTSIVGFSATNFNVNATGFTNNNATAGGRVFGISNVGNDLYITYAVPEPATWTLLAFSLTTVMVLRRRNWIHS